MKKKKEETEVEVVFIPTLHKGMKEFYFPKKKIKQNLFSKLTKEKEWDNILSSITPEQREKMKTFGKKLGQATVDALNLVNKEKES